ncbi:MAG: signal peptidase I [Halobacteriales archaeon]
MSLRRYLGLALTVVFILAVGSILLGGILGQPILLSFVESGSMSPTLETGDGFIAIPTAVAGDVEIGDVVIFDAQQIEGGGLTTHRVVGESETGYITKGDANPFDDQDSDEPPVTDGQIKAVALQVDGHVVAIPGLGRVVWTLQDWVETGQGTLASWTGADALLGTQGLAILIGGGGLLVLAWGLLGGDDRRLRDRVRKRDQGIHPYSIVIAMAVMLLAVTAITTVAMSGTHGYDMVSAEFESDRPTTVQIGTSKELPHTAANGGRMPTYTFFEPASTYVDVDPTTFRLDPDEERNVTVTLTAPSDTGYYPQYVAEHRYVATLPYGVVAGLHAVHPWLAIFATSALLPAILTLIGVAFVGTGRIRRRSRSRR